jgi:hypothetical protein
MTSKWAVVAGIIVMTVVVVMTSALSVALRERADTDASPKSARRLRLWSRLLAAVSSAAPLGFIAGLSSDGIHYLLARPDWTLLFMFGTFAIVGAMVAGVFYKSRAPDRATATRRAVAFFAFSLLALFVLVALPLGLEALGVPYWLRIGAHALAFTALFFASDTYVNVAVPRAETGR